MNKEAAKEFGKEAKAIEEEARETISLATVVTIETSRMFLRAWKETDANDFFEYAKSSEVGPNAGWPPHKSIEESEAIIDRFIRSGEVWAIEHKNDHKVIGSIGLHRDVKRTDINCRMLGYVLSPEYWGQELMSEAVQAILKHAFIYLNISLISVYHYPFNNRSRKVIEKNGFKYEGTLRQASKIHDGSIFDDVCYSMTLEEYERIHNKANK